MQLRTARSRRPRLVSAVRRADLLGLGRGASRGAGRGGGGSDRQKRLAYDSLDTIGDVTPTEEDVAEGGFFEVLRPAFELNARWSTASKVLSVSVCARARVVHRVQRLPTTTSVVVAGERTVAGGGGGGGGGPAVRGSAGS